MEAGPPTYRDEKRRQYRERRAAYAATNLRWLELQHCQLTAAGQHALAKLKLIHPKWNDSWADDADDSHDGRGGWVREISDPGDLDLLPLDQVIDTALARTKRPMRELASYHPFRGLVEEHPYKALAALRAAYRKGAFPQELWSDLFSKWPENTTPRLQCLLGRSFIKLSPAQAITLRFDAPRWLEKQLPALYTHSRTNALAIFDGFLQHFLSSPPDATDSGIGTTTIAGVEQQQSEVSVSKAINSPIGALAQALWELTPKKAKRHGSLNRNLASRFERLAAAPGHGGGHAVAVLTQHMGWIDYCFHDWAEAFLLPMFSRPSLPNGLMARLNATPCRALGNSSRRRCSRS
ncbi:hypothetical protein [Sphingobium sp. CAP-1]|uniref:hypothetical protein n=1 Tax=Sphingobium sp. CAP-1 TaxID=2676077 RepID=UPI0012BB2B46|nr:hypothetical protein [Sphingobium sp. CAP-1]QGP79388.1 hypothetical protein GL174_10635 [Sphingobium sp. CAP-1]